VAETGGLRTKLARLAELARRTLVMAASCLLLAGAAACGSSQAASQSAKYEPVPTSSWRPGDPSLTALTIGPLSAGMVRGRWCIWLGGRGSRREAVVWPAGFRARRHPVELVDSRGTVVARGGERIKIGGGIGPAGRRPCMLGQKNAWFAMSYPTAASRR
jgi:hypothetical protein